MHLSVDPGPPGLAVQGGTGQLERVLLNLLSNAIKFSRTGDQVRVSAGPTPAGSADGAGRVALTVSDTGIPAADQKQLFSRFHRTSNATSRGIAGTGLGLTIARSIVDHHGGSLRLTSVEGAATTVEVVLPAHRTVPHTPADTTGRLTQPA